MVVPEELEELSIVCHTGIVIQIHSLGVISKTVVRWIDFGATSVADPSPDDTFSTSELGLGEPKSAHAKGGLFGGHFGFV